MTHITLSTGKQISASWVAEIRSGLGGIMIDLPDAPFSLLAELLEDANSVQWETEDGDAPIVSYSTIRHMTRSDGHVQIILNKGVA